ncbi:MAG: tetraacyldisaccharide 4'-kinase [Steroidobacteraceae bacterium]
MSVQSWFDEIWYERATAPWWLLPLSGIYGAAAALRRGAYAKHWLRSTRLPCPLIVVGNLSVGGTGKTPLVCWLVAQLAGRGLRPGVVTRGYGGSSRVARLVNAADDPDIVGDEPILLARRTNVPVAIGRDRPAAARLLIDAGCDLIVSDDGLQHYAMARDCEIVVIDADRRFGNGRLLPAGPLREPAARLSGVDAIVVNGGDPGAGGAAGFGHAPAGAAMRMQLLATSAIALRGGTVKALSEFAGQPVHALAAIGNPQRFFNLLRARGIEVAARPLPDHAQLHIDDISFADDRPVLMTEKDAVKCAKIAGAQHWYVPVSATFGAGESETLLGIVARNIQKRAAEA